jgi:transcriptional regulator with XRE-family HTH domain
MRHNLTYNGYEILCTKAEMARQLGVSRTHITLLTQGKRKLSKRLADKLADRLDNMRIGKKADVPNALPVASNPLGGSKAVFGRFDSYALPPVPMNTSTHLAILFYLIAI